MRLSHVLMQCALVGLSSLTGLAHAEGWQAGTYADGDFKLPYQFYEPAKVSAAQPLPLVIYLHGSGEAGTDNQAQLYKGQNVGPDYFASTSIQSIQATYVLAPQTPGPIRWASTGLGEYDLESTPVTLSMNALLKLLDELKKNPGIDTHRIYLAGLSRGGQGVWNAALLRPQEFAAIVPIAGAGSPKYAARIAQLPIWAFHGSGDTTTSVEVTRNMIKALREAGATDKTLRYTEIAGGEHPSSWLTAHQDVELWRWMIQWRHP